MGSAFGQLLGAILSDKNAKEDITPVKEGDTLKRLKKLPFSRWSYKGDETKHLGPMAQDFKRVFGVGDGKTLAPVDLFGVLLASMKDMGVANA